MCRKNVFSRLLTPPFWCSMTPNRAIDLPRADTEGLALGTEMSTILPTFEVQCVSISAEPPTFSINPLLDPNQRYSVSKVLSLDVKRFREELTAAEESSRDTVVEKYKSLVREREEVLNYFAHCKSVDSLYCSSRLLCTN